MQDFQRYLFILILFLFGYSLSGCHTESTYEIDNNKVYYNYWNEGSGSHHILISRADGQSFKVLNSSYAKDINHAYYHDKIIIDAHAKTFQVLADYYAKDASSAFYLDGKIKGADGNSFEIVDDGVYAKDKNDFYYQDTPLNVSDLESFKILGNGWAKDKSFYYISVTSVLTNKYPLADYRSFELLKGGYAKDNIQVYYYGHILKSADPGTFKVINYTKARDKNNCYKGDNIVNCNE